jgi:hypothetical protein
MPARQLGREQALARLFVAAAIDIAIEKPPLMIRWQLEIDNGVGKVEGGVEHVHPGFARAVMLEIRL